MDTFRWGSGVTSLGEWEQQLARLYMSEQHRVTLQKQGLPCYLIGNKYIYTILTKKQGRLEIISCAANCTRSVFRLLTFSKWQKVDIRYKADFQKSKILSLVYNWSVSWSNMSLCTWTDQRAYMRAVVRDGLVLTRIKEVLVSEIWFSALPSYYRSYPLWNLSWKTHLEDWRSGQGDWAGGSYLSQRAHDV